MFFPGRPVSGLPSVSIVSNRDPEMTHRINRSRQVVRELKNFQGTYCVMVTPFKGKEELDLDGYRSNIEFYIENGIHGLIAGGSTGEFAALELDELRRVISAAVDQVAGRVPVLAGTGQCSTRQTIAVSKHAQDAGADG